MTYAATQRLTCNGVELESKPEALGELESLDVMNATTQQLQSHMVNDGYFLARGLLSEAAIHRARQEAHHELRQRGLLVPAEPCALDLPTTHLKKKHVLSGFGVLPEIRALLREAPLVDTFAKLLGGPPRMLDHVLLRMVPPGQSTTPHCDIVYMGGGTQRLYTAWIVLSDVPRASGALMLLERSHQIESLRDKYWNLDVDRDRLRTRIRLKHWKLVREGKYSNNARGVQREFGRRWLTTDYRAGDVIVFSMFMMHGTLDNQSDHARVSIDVRWQLAAEPVDLRWVGTGSPGEYT